MKGRGFSRAATPGNLVEQAFRPAQGSADLQVRVTAAFVGVRAGFSRRHPMTKTYFITASAYMHQNLFQKTETADLLVTTLFGYRDRGEFLLHEFVVMPNHIHLLLSTDEAHIGRAIQTVKGGFSHALGKSGLKFKAVWQPSYYEHRVRDEDEYERMRNYIHQNPVRRGLSDRAIDYPYSSARTSWHLDEVPERLKPDFQELAVTRP